jgi:hypothetical protein
MRDLELDDIFIFGVVSLFIQNQEVRLLIQIGDEVFEDLQEVLIRLNQGEGENACLVALRGQKEDGRRVKERLILEYLDDETWQRVNQMPLIISHEGLQLEL